jgi:hypothetical protein
MSLTALDLNGAALREQLAKIEAEQHNSVEATIEQDGVTASISTEKKGWTFTGYVRKVWKGDVEGGARVKKEF